MGNPAIPSSLCYTGVSGTEIQRCKLSLLPVWAKRFRDISSRVSKNFSVQTPSFTDSLSTGDHPGSLDMLFQLIHFLTEQCQHQAREPKVVEAHIAGTGGTAV